MGLEPTIVHWLHVTLGTLHKKSFETGSMCGDLLCSAEFVLMTFRGYSECLLKISSMRANLVL